MKKISILLMALLAFAVIGVSFAADSDMSVYVADITSGETAHVQITLPSDAQGKVNVSLNGQNYEANLVDGKATIDLNGLNPGNYTLTVKYDGSGNYSEITKKVSLKVADSTPSSAEPINASGEPTEVANTTDTNSTKATGSDLISNSTNSTNSTNTTNTTNNTTPQKMRVKSLHLRSSLLKNSLLRLSMI